MPGFKPSPALIASLEGAFTNSPVRNIKPDGIAGPLGITLHLDVDDSEGGGVGIPHTPNVKFSGDKRFVDSFQKIKKDHFGKVVERADTVDVKRVDRTTAKQHRYHYSIFGDNYDEAPRDSGIAETPGDDLFISVGIWPADAALDGRVAGAFMHELGHNLGLRHGGNTNVEEQTCKK